jgi:predicted regulator of Ras-like GTPase activity (Roadblock/LC7/MglB family)
MSLTTLLGKLTAIEGIRAVVIAGRDGLSIAHSDQPIDEAEALAAFGAQAFSAADALGAETHRTGLVGLVLEYGDALVSVDPLGEMALTVTRLDTAAVLVPLRVTLRQMRGELLATLDAM